MCRILRHLIQGSERLAYIIELGISGMVDGPSIACQSATERLRALRRYNAQVYATSPTSEEAEEYEKSGWSAPQRAVARRGCWPTAYVTDHGRTLVVHGLRSIEEGLEARRWTVPLEDGVRLVAIDVAQDLLVLCEDGLDPS